MNNIKMIIDKSVLPKFFRAEETLFKSHKELKNADIIQLNLSIDDIYWVETSERDFMKACENFLSMFNYSTGKYHTNITFNHLQVGDKVGKNCLILNTYPEAGKWWYIKTGKIIKMQKKELEKTLHDEIHLLVEKRELSVRKIMKLWISQKISREIYEYLKDIWVFSINPENNTEKVYNPEMLEIFTKEMLDEMIWISV